MFYGLSTVVNFDLEDFLKGFTEKCNKQSPFRVADETFFHVNFSKTFHYNCRFI